MNCGEAVGGDDHVVAMALKVIGQHAHMRLEKGDSERKVSQKEKIDRLKNKGLFCTILHKYCFGVASLNNISEAVFETP